MEHFSNFLEKRCRVGEHSTMELCPNIMVLRIQSGNCFFHGPESCANVRVENTPNKTPRSPALNPKM